MDNAQRRAKTAALVVLFAGMIFAMMLPSALAHYLTERALTTSSEIVVIEVTLERMGRHDKESLDPYVYTYRVGGIDYQGDTQNIGFPSYPHHVAIQQDESGRRWARLLYASDDPAYHRLDPPEHTFGITWIAAFPSLLTLTLLLGSIAWLIASYGHLTRLHHSVDRLIVLLNAATALVLLALPFTLITLIIALHGKYDHLFANWPGPLAILCLLLTLTFSLIPLIKISLNLEKQPKTGKPREASRGGGE